VTVERTEDDNIYLDTFIVEPKHNDTDHLADTQDNYKLIEVSTK